MKKLAESENFSRSISVLLQVTSWIKSSEVFREVFSVFIKKHNKILVGFCHILYIVVCFYFIVSIAPF